MTPGVKFAAAQFLFGAAHGHQSSPPSSDWEFARLPLHAQTVLRGGQEVLGPTAPAESLARSNNLGKLPALGWNTWNAYHCDIDEQKVLSAAEHIVKLGLKDVGYEYVNIDDCWSVKGRRDNYGRLIPDFDKFPDGIAGLATKVHGMGLKLGIYSSAGTETCAGYPASLGYEDVDVQTWAEWGIDYLKYDNCNIPVEWRDDCKFCKELNTTCGEGFCGKDVNWSKSKTAERYRRMQDALATIDRPMLYSLCEWGEADVPTWGNQTAASWRTTDDIFTEWRSVLDILNRNAFTLNYVNFWGHSDADMLEIGNGMSLAEEQSHFALWAAMKSPLLVGTDLTRIRPQSLDILKNKHLLGFNQDDVYGAPAKPYKWGSNPNWTFNSTHPPEYWSGRSKQGTLVLVLNLEDSIQKKNINWGEVPELEEGRSYRVVDVWTDVDWGCIRGGVDIEVAAHGTRVILAKERINTAGLRCSKGRLGSFDSNGAAVRLQPKTN